MSVLVAILLANLLAPSTVAAAEESPPAVEFEVRAQEEGPVTDPSRETIRVSVDQPLDFRLRVFESGNRDAPVSDVDPSNLVRIESANGATSPTLSHAWFEVVPGTFQATYIFEQPGTFRVTILPGLESRESLPEGSTDWVEFEVDESVDLWVGLMGVGALVLVVGLIVVAATRGKPRVPKEPIPHDTWWNSP